MRIGLQTRLNLVTLEDRATPATFTVTTVVDNGSNGTPTSGSLREAILKANTTAGADTIAFNISGGGVQTIAPPLALPDITEAVTIDGTTQTNFAGTPVIRLDGASAGAGANGLNLVNHTGSTVQSLTIGNFSGAGVRISGGGSHTVLGSFLGTTQNGTAAAGNGTGVSIVGVSVGNRVGGGGASDRNIISGNTGAGVLIDNSYSNLVAGNFLGTDVNGSNAVANVGGGVGLVNGAAGNTIGGIGAGLGNVISGNGTAGVLLTGAATNGNIITGNRIGLGFSGAALGNAVGIKAFNAAGSAPPGGIIPGSENAIRSNTIAANSGAGVAVLDTARQVRIEGNSIRDNVGLGIQTDSTANAGLAAPVISTLKAVSNGFNAIGTITGIANTKYTVALFTNSVQDASGFGEGQTQLTTASVTTDGSGSGSFTIFISSTTAGAFISTTATDTALGDTSSFSNAFGRPDQVLNANSYAIGGGSGGAPTVVRTNNAGSSIQTVTPFDPAFTGGVRVATGDLTGDGIPDLLSGTGPGIQAEIRVSNGVTGQLLFVLNPFGEFNRGVYVALGDVNNDGTADIIVSPDEGGGPRVRVFNGKTFTQIADFFGIEDVNFRGGARVAVGDINNDKSGDIIVSAGFGGGPRIAIFSGATLTTTGGPKLFGDFFAFETSLRNGAFVSAADVNGDGFADLVVAAGAGGAPRVKIFSGQTLINSSGTVLTATADFFAGNASGRAGARVMARDLDGDGKADLVAAEADGNTLRVYSGAVLATGTATVANTFSILNARSGGLYVG